MPLEDLGLSTRPLRALQRAGIRELSQLRGLSDEELLALPGLGRSSLREIRAKLSRPRQVLRVEGTLWSNSQDPTPLTDLPLPPRVSNRLCEAGVSTLGQLSHLTSADFQRLPGLGAKSLVALRQALALGSLPPGLSSRTRNALARAGIRDLDALKHMGWEPILGLRGIGQAAIAELEAYHPLPATGELPLESLGLSPRLSRALARSGIRGTAQIRQLGAQGIWNLPGVGAGGLAEIHRALDRLSQAPGAEEDFGSLDDVIESLLANLRLRERQILTAIYGFFSPPQSLEAIGKRNHLSRERVRQLKEQSLTRLTGLLNQVGVGSVFTRLDEALTSAGGFLHQSQIQTGLLSLYPAAEISPQAAISFLLDLSPHIRWQSGVWGRRDLPWTELDPLLKTVNQVLVQKKPQTLAIPSELRSALASACRAHPHMSLRGDLLVPVAWGPPTRKEMARSILEAVGHPLHYRQIASLAGKEEASQSFLSVLRDEDGFERVSPGTYRLRKGRIESEQE